MSETLNNQLPVLEISDAELEKNKQRQTEAESILTPPEGQVLVGLRSFCPIHGDITRASKIIKYTLYMKNAKGEVAPYAFSEAICLACVADKWRNEIVTTYPKTQDGKPGTIQVAPVFVTKQEYLQHEIENMNQVKAQLQEQLKGELKSEEAEEVKNRIADVEADLEKAQKSLEELNKDVKPVEG